MYKRQVQDGRRRAAEILEHEAGIVLFPEEKPVDPELRPIAQGLRRHGGDGRHQEGYDEYLESRQGVKEAGCQGDDEKVGNADDRRRDGVEEPFPDDERDIHQVVAQDGIVNRMAFSRLAAWSTG